MAPPKKAVAPQKRVRRTRAQIEADNLAEQQRREDLAQQRAARIPEPVTPKFRKLYHIVNDGHTVFGQLMYRGQEFIVEEDTPEFELAFDRRGNYVFGKDDNEQIEAYGEVKYREGPWPGKPYDLSVYEPGQIDGEGKTIKPNPAEIAALQKANKRLHVE